LVDEAVRDPLDGKEDQALWQNLCPGDDVDVRSRLGLGDPRFGEGAPGAPDGQVRSGLDAAVAEDVIAAAGESAMDSRYWRLRGTKGRVKRGFRKPGSPGLYQRTPELCRAGWGVAAKAASIAWAKATTERRRWALATGRSGGRL
jgi:hypothetical protein